MKKLLIVVLALGLITSAAHAQESDDEVVTCEDYGELAGLIMRSRQAGVPLAQMMAIVRDDPVMREAALMAYETPRYNTDSIRQREIADFRDSWTVICYRARGN